jgi:hypothetical protein
MGSARNSGPDPRREGSPLRVCIPPGRMAEKVGAPLVPRARAECDRAVRLAPGILPPGWSATTRSEIGQSCVSVKLQGVRQDEADSCEPRSIFSMGRRIELRGPPETFRVPGPYLVLKVALPLSQVLPPGILECIHWSPSGWAAA